MKEAPGIDCYCCGRVLGTNAECGRGHVSAALRNRPPCVWQHTDPSIVVTCVRKMKEKQDAEAKVPGAAGAKSQVRTMLSKRPDIPVLGIGTQVFVPRAREAECGPRGHVSDWNKITRMYTVTWNALNPLGIKKRSVVPHRDVYEYIEDCQTFPDDALQFDTSVRCGEGQQLVPGIVQGVVLDNVSQAPKYYYVGPNATGSHMYYSADQVHVVAGAHGLDEELSKRLYQVGAMTLQHWATQSSQQPPGDAPSDAGAATPRSSLLSPAAKPAAVTPKHDGNSESESSGSATPGSGKSDSSISSDSESGSSISSSSPTPPPPPPPQPAPKPRVKAAAKKTGAQGPAGQRALGTACDKEQRAAKFNFKHDDAETHTIFMQLATNVPWAHSHRGQKQIWKLHLTALQDEGHATELMGHKDAVKTFMAWAAAICKARRTWRLAQAKKSGFAHDNNDAVDDVAQKWEEKVCGEAALTVNNQERAVLMRDMMTSTGKGNAEKAANIEKLRKKRYATPASQAAGQEADPKPTTTPPSKVSKRSVSQSPTEARQILMQGITSMTQGTAETDAAFVTDIVARVVAGLAPAQAPPQPAVPSHAGDLHLLQLLLQQEDSSLVSWAPQIFEALGISDTAHFSELSVADILLAAGIPSMQKRRLINVGRRFGLNDS